MQYKLMLIDWWKLMFKKMAETRKMFSFVVLNEIFIFLVTTYIFKFPSVSALDFMG